MELSKCEQFTKEQLIAYAGHVIKTAADYPHTTPAQADKRLAELAMATLTAPNDVPRRVLEGICDMSDGGVNAQGIWELCKAAIMGGVK